MYLQLWSHLLPRLEIPISNITFSITKLRNYSLDVDFNQCVPIIHFPRFEGWSLTSLCLLSVSLFSKAFSFSTSFRSFPLANYIWKSKVQLRVKTFAWLVANMKVNTNDIAKALRSTWCVMWEEWRINGSSLFLFLSSIDIME